MHISQIQDGGVGKVEDVLTIGQEVQVRIVQVEKEKRRIALSMRPWTEASAEDEKRGRRGGGGGGRGGGFDSGCAVVREVVHVHKRIYTRARS